MNGRVFCVRLGLSGDGEFLLNGQFLGISPQLFIFLSNFDQSDLPETRLRLSNSGFGTKCIESFLESYRESIVFDKLRIKIIK